MSVSMYLWSRARCYLLHNLLMCKMALIDSTVSEGALLWLSFIALVCVEFANAEPFNSYSAETVSKDTWKTIRSICLISCSYQVGY